MSQNQIRQGNTFAFTVEPSGDNASGLDGEFYLQQEPGDTAAVNRALTNNGDGTFSGILTNAETDTLNIGQWFIVTLFTDTDEYISEPIKLYIGKKWIATAEVVVLPLSVAITFPADLQAAPGSFFWNVPTGAAGTVTVTGGTTPYNYLWSAPTGGAIEAINDVTLEFCNITTDSSGGGGSETVTLTVTDSAAVPLVEADTAIVNVEGF